MIIKSILVVPSVSLQDNSPVTKWPGWPLYSPQTPSSCCWLFAGAQIRRLSATGSGESSRWSLWRSGLALFNTASTSNNSRLWQLCIIHLVESLSLFPLWRSSLPLLFQFLFSSSAFFCASQRLEKGRGRTRAVFHQMLPVSPWHWWFWRHRSVCLQRDAQTLNSGCHLNQIVFVLYRGSMPKFLTATRTVDLLPKNTQISIKIVIFFFL